MFLFLKKHIKLFLLILGVLGVNLLLHYVQRDNSIEVIYLITSILSLIGIIIYYVYKLDWMTAEASTCQLTGIYNRKMFFESLDHEIEKSKRMNLPLSILYFDIDDFSNINNTLGHYTGDQVLIALVETIKESLRSYDIFARVGGEEFAIIMPNTTIDKAYLISERLRNLVKSIKIKKDMKLTISIGVMKWSLKEDSNSIYHKIDDAMFYSKENGKDRTTIWKDSIYEK